MPPIARINILDCSDERAASMPPPVIIVPIVEPKETNIAISAGTSVRIVNINVNIVINSQNTNVSSLLFENTCVLSLRPLTDFFITTAGKNVKKYNDSIIDNSHPTIGMKLTAITMSATIIEAANALKYAPFTDDFSRERSLSLPNQYCLEFSTTNIRRYNSISDITTKRTINTMTYPKSPNIAEKLPAASAGIIVL